MRKSSLEMEIRKDGSMGRSSGGVCGHNHIPSGAPLSLSLDDFSKLSGLCTMGFGTACSKTLTCHFHGSNGRTEGS